jgi:UDP-N-acetylmuramyl pentapeptide phosphotransferase/UDP-N-acetylglucosamine-1-phosphate transferase
MNIPEPLLSLATIAIAAALSSCIIHLIRPLLQLYALARPNARSSHQIPTPQGAGVAVITATLLVTALAATTAGLPLPPALFGAILFIALVGMVDDIRSIPVLPRLLLQAVAVGALISCVPDNLRLAPVWPLWTERALILLAGLWFVNLVNFMDGLDLMTVSEVVPVTAALILLAWLGELGPLPGLAAAALCGAMLGFAPYNRPVAKVFLGDVGSLPIGLLLGWCLLNLACHQHMMAAFLLPLYYLADATVTLLRRIVRHEPFWLAHRTHYYQRATDNGLAVHRVVTEVFALNIVLTFLALVSVRSNSLLLSLIIGLTGVAIVALALFRFSRRPD